MQILKNQKYNQKHKNQLNKWNTPKNILDYIKENEMNDSWFQAMFKQYRKNIYVISKCVLTFTNQKKANTKTNANLDHIFKVSNFRVVQNLFQDTASLDMTPND